MPNVTFGSHLSSEETNANSGSLNSTPYTSSTSQPYSMTEEMLQARRFLTERGRFITQFYAVVIACISSISQGTVLGWSAPAVNTIKEGIPEDDTLDVKNFAWICSLAPLGFSFGIIVWTYFNVTIGPRKTMLFQAPFLFTTWIALSLVQKVELAYAGRFFSSFFSISYMVCGETLLQDSLNRNNLKYMMMAFRSCVCVGILLSYIVGFLWTDELYYTGSAAILVGIHFVMLISVPESPVFLYDRNPKQAEKSLTWYRGRSNIVLEMREIKRDSEIRNLDPNSFRYMLLSKVVIRGILIVVGMAFFQVLNGYYLIMFYNLLICKSSQRKVTTKSTIVFSKFADALILGFTFLISKIAATYVHYNVPRGVKKPLLISGLSSAICLILMGAYNILTDFYPTIFKPPHWLNLAAAMGIIISYEIGLGEYPAMMLYYYMPYQIYSRAKVIVNFTHWFLCFLSVQFFIKIQEAIFYEEIIFFVLAACCLLSLLYTKVFIVEFKHQTLIQIQLALGGNPIGSRGGHNRDTY